MSVDFDASTGRLQAGRSELDALLAWSDGASADPAGLASLEAAGAVQDESPHPRLAPLLEVLADPVCVLGVESSGPPALEGGVVPGLAAVTVRGADGETWQLFGADPSFLPALVARVVGLGPRRRTGDEPRQLGADELAERCAAPGHVRWTATTTWSTPDGPAGRRVDVLDHSPVGLWLLEPADRLTLLWPTTSTAVWRSLTTLLPGDDELGRGEPGV